MNEPTDKPRAKRDDFARRVGMQARRRLKARRGNGVWFGLGMMGLIGWSIVVPTLLGAVLGHWLDNRQLGGRSWTLALLIAGLVLGCWNAWRWVSNEDKAMREDSDNDDE
ncbi:MAG: AtpZ/AtpI family protein [Mesorhizobium sp.]